MLSRHFLKDIYDIYADTRATSFRARERASLALVRQARHLSLVMLHATLAQAAPASWAASATTLSKRVAFKSPSPSRLTTPQLAQRGQQWHALISIVAALAQRRCSFIVYGTPVVRLVAEALSQHSWSGSKLHWLLRRSSWQSDALTAALRGWGRVSTDSCLLLAAPVQRTQLLRLVADTNTPMLGVGLTASVTGLVWATGSGITGSIETQFLFLAACWFFFQRTSAVGAMLA